ncbi:hypothetical protein BASA60_002641 [Batrachochytrium salamandrivorans]|nr:hypothetical protein BASA60_002641 [Batrachochytrium salamandrivorans]
MSAPLPLAHALPSSTLDSYKTYPDLAVETNGGKILFATDDFFAVAENMIAASNPVWDEAKYTEHANTYSPMTVSRENGWTAGRPAVSVLLAMTGCIIKLGLPGQIIAVDADTAFFTGNNVPAISIQAACLTDAQVALVPRRSEMGSKATEQETEAALALASHNWTCILPMTPLGAGYPETRHNVIQIPNLNDASTTPEGSKVTQQRWTHLRVNVYPDGGLARLRVYGVVIPDWKTLLQEHALGSSSLIDLGSLSTAVRRSLGMFDGWETSRNPQRPREYVMGSDGMLEMPGSEWAIVALGTRGAVLRVIVDTNHYKGNYPESCVVQGVDLSNAADDPLQMLSNDQQSLDWFDILPRTSLGPHHEHDVDVSRFVMQANGLPRACTHVRLVMYPDGGVSRLRLFGSIVPQSS